jgi:hypothetical protein
MPILDIGKDGQSRRRGVCSLKPKDGLILDDWWQFNDSKVSPVPESKILSLDGGGESDTAYSISSS